MAAFWLNLKQAYDAFERTHVPPRVGVCDRRYIVGEGGLAEEVVAPPDNGAPTAFGICEDAIAGIVPLAGAEAERAVHVAARSPGWPPGREAAAPPGATCGPTTRRRGGPAWPRTPGACARAVCGRSSGPLRCSAPARRE